MQLSTTTALRTSIHHSFQFQRCLDVNAFNNQNIFCIDCQPIGQSCRKRIRRLSQCLWHYTNIGSPDAISQRQSVSLNDTILAAVYAELSSKGAKNRNVVVSGLQSKAGRSDADVFQAVCADHLHCHPVHHHQTSRQVSAQPATTSTSGACTEEHAADLQRIAKLLRNSSDESIRSSVFIKADLTPAERKSSYDQRCLRRQRVAAKSANSSSTAATNRPSATQETSHTSAAASSLSSIAQKKTVKRATTSRTTCIRN